MSTRTLSPLRGLLGFRPRPVPPHVFAIEPERLAYGRFMRTEGGFEPADYREVELPPNLFQNGLLGGPVREPQELGTALATLLDGLASPVQEASLVVPDTWLRITFTGVSELPSDPRARDDVLRWKLKRLVPFRVEELRLGSVEVTPLPGSADREPRRLLLGFALETLLKQIEDAFESTGVRLGQITSASLALLGLLAPPAQDRTEDAMEPDLTALALVEDGGYTLVFARDGEPVLHRFKGSATPLSASTREGMVERELKLTHRFLEQHLPGGSLQRVVLACPPESEPEWIEWLEAGLGQTVEPLSRRHLPLSGEAALAASEGAPPWRRLAPMLGAASQEVS